MDRNPKKRILLVEAETNLAQAEALCRLGYAVSRADTPAQAIELGSSPQIDLVLVDVDSCLGAGAVEAAAQILLGRAVPVVFLVAHTTQDICEPVRRLSHCGFIVKGSSDFILQSALEMAFELFAARLAGENEFKSQVARVSQLEEEVTRRQNEKEILLREIHHRVKNNLTVITTLLMLQEGEMRDPEAAQALLEARGRIVSMMAFYDRLYRSANPSLVRLDDYLETLLEDIRLNWRGVSGEIIIQSEIENLPVDHSLFFPIGVIVYELVTNAYSHAYPRGTTGSVQVSLHPLASEPDGRPRLLLTVCDRGRSLPAAFDFNQPATFGLNLVKILSEQIQARVDLVSGNGTSFRIEVPY